MTSNAVEPMTAAIIGRALLARLEAMYLQYGVPLPERRYWTTGTLPPDCEQVVVSLVALREGLVNDQGDAGSAQQPCQTFVLADYVITISHCFPTPDDRGNLPLPEQIGEAADRAATDAYLLEKLAGCWFDITGYDVNPDILQRTDENGDLLPIPSGFGVDASVEIEDPQGGVQSVSLKLGLVIG